MRRCSGSPAMASRDLQAADADRQHAQRPGRAGVRVGARPASCRGRRSAACGWGATRRCRAWSTRGRSGGGASAGRRGPRRCVSSACSRLWSTYWTLTSVRARSRPSASSSCITSVPVASWVRVWSIRSAISAPGSIRPSTRWSSMSLCDTVLPMSSTTRRRESATALPLLRDRRATVVPREWTRWEPGVHASTITRTARCPRRAPRGRIVARRTPCSAVDDAFVVPRRSILLLSESAC